MAKRVEAAERPRSKSRVPLFLVVLSGLFLLVVLPVVIHGGPLSDDYHNCLRPREIGFTAFLGESARRLGVVRPARFLEIFATAPLCRRVPFGLIILFPLGLTLLVAYLLWGLLRDLDLPSPWPEIGSALWLLHPLGAEAALWPSALHVPLGLAFALAALRLHRRGRHGWGMAAALGAFLSLEQTILALPLAVWMASGRGNRKVATIATGGATAIVAVAYTLWPGIDPRAGVPVLHRLVSVFSDPVWYVEFPAAGLGVHSIPLAILWAFPLSLVILTAGAWIGSRLGRAALSGREPLPQLGRRSWIRWAVGIGTLALLVNLPLMTTVPRGHAPRSFTPTWLLISAVVPLIGPRIQLPRPTVTGAIAGAFAAAALLSIALSVSVRLDNHKFTVDSSRYLADHVSNGQVIAVCGVRRTVVSPAPLGSFALHELIYDWSAEDSLRYYTGRVASFRLGGPLWRTACPNLNGVNLTVTFDQLLRVAGLHA